MTTETTSTEKRRVLLLGAGPLPSPDAAAAPGVANRLWQFVRTALAGGHDCLVVTLEATAPRAGGRGATTVESGAWRWLHLAAPVEDFKDPAQLAPAVREFAPDVVVAAGTLQAAATACALAEDRPVWVDLFGDPLAEVQAKASILSGRFDREEHLFVWEMMLDVLLRADAFSTVSRRQRDALLGQLLLMGMTDAQVAGGARGGDEDPATLHDLIHVMPCAMESFPETVARRAGAERSAWLAAHDLPRDAEVALWSGGFNAWVDPATLVRGAEHAMQRRPRLHCVLTGGALPGYLDAVYDELLRAVEASPMRGRFHPLGWVALEDAERWIAAADVGLMVDRPCAETRLGARNRLLSFAAGGCPIVATCGTEVVEEMAAVGALRSVPTGDAEALANAIVAVLETPDRGASMARIALDYCHRHYTFEAAGGPLLRFIERAEAPDGATGDFSPDQTESAAEWVARYIDPRTRREEWAELARYRAGRLARLRRWLTRR